MIKLIKNIFTSVILYERMLGKFESVILKKPKEKTYRIKLSKSNIELLAACYRYGITNESNIKEGMKND